MAEWWRQLSDGISGFAEQLVQQANSAQQDIEREHQRLATERAAERIKQVENDSLPWDVNFIPAPIGSDRDKDREALTILEQDLMEQILALSLSTGNFSIAPINAEEIKSQRLFHFSSFVPIAMRLLQLDANLARMHSKLSPKMDEQIFWFYYYCRVLYLRAAVGMDGPEAKVRAATWLKTQPDIIHRLTAPSPPKITTTSSSYSSQSFVAPISTGPVPKSLVGNFTTTTAVAAAGPAESSGKGSAESTQDMKKMLEDLDFDLDDLNLDEEEDTAGSGESFEKIDMLGNKISSSKGSADDEDLDEDAALERQIALELAEED